MWQAYWFLDFYTLDWSRAKIEEFLDACQVRVMSLHRGALRARAAQLVQEAGVLVGTSSHLGLCAFVCVTSR
jgi:hypothetical protein